MGAGLRVLGLHGAPGPGLADGVVVVRVAGLGRFGPRLRGELLVLFTVIR